MGWLSALFIGKRKSFDDPEFEPFRAEDVLKCKMKDKWLEAERVEDEEGFMEMNAVEAVKKSSLPEGTKIGHCFRIYKIKSDGRFKVRNVVDRLYTN